MGPEEVGPATGYLSTWREEEFAISVITALEFLEGYGDPSDGESFLSPFRQIELTGEPADRQPGAPRFTPARRAHRRLRHPDRGHGDERGRVLGHGNSRHFQRVDGLRVETYR